MPIILNNEVSMPISVEGPDGTNIQAWPDNIPNTIKINGQSVNTFGFINPFDKGGWSIGLIQWHHCRAFDLLYYIASKDTNWKSKFPDTDLDLVRDLEASLRSNNASNYRGKYQATYHPTPGTSAYIGIYNMLTSDIGKKSQIEYASADIQDLISHLQNDYSITNPAIIIYLTDILNQYGRNKNLTKSEASKISEKSNLGIMEQLDEFVKWCEGNLGDYRLYIRRRDNTYAYISELYKQGKLNSANLVDMGYVATSKYIPEVGQYLWPVPSSDTVNCYWGYASDQRARHNAGFNYKWAGIIHSDFHAGIDIGPKTGGVDGDPLIAVGDGTVAYIRTGGVEHRGPITQANPVIGPGEGNCIIIQMDRNNQHYFAYMHLCKPPIHKVGDRVKAGEIVGYMGSTGSSTGTHLHLGLHIGSAWATKSKTGRPDPLPYLGKRIG